MRFINTFLEWLPTMIVVVAVAVNAILIAARVARNAESNVKEWLLLAVTEAEKALGSGTGQLKLRQTYQQFISLFPAFSKLVGFNTFAGWVDEALGKMKHLMETNTSITEYIGTETNAKEESVGR